MAIRGHFAVRGTQIYLLMWINTIRHEQEHFVINYLADFSFLSIQLQLEIIYLKFDKVIGISCHTQVSRSTIEILRERTSFLDSWFTSHVEKNEVQVVKSQFFFSFDNYDIFKLFQLSTRQLRPEQHRLQPLK